nr:MAG TPA: hypothetical protein [Caudoviricetes sp.]
MQLLHYLDKKVKIFLGCFVFLDYLCFCQVKTIFQLLISCNP